MSEIEFNIHYITYYGQDLYIAFQSGEEIPMQWTKDHLWVGRKMINAPQHIEWYYIVKYDGKVQRVEEVQGVRAYDFNGANCTVRDWWHYPFLTNVFIHEKTEEEKRKE